MKKFTACFLLVIAAAFTSCSSDDSPSVTPPPTVDQNNSFTYNLNGTAVPISTMNAVRMGDRFVAAGNNEDGRTMGLEFDIHGNFVDAYNAPPDGSSIPDKASHFDFAAHYFTFNIVAIDEANKIIKFNYSGKLYYDEYDLSSEADDVSGTVNIHYTVAPPAGPTQVSFAKIGGQDWYGVKSDVSGNGGIEEDVELSMYSDDEYRITVYYNLASTAAGTYAFNDASVNNKVTISKYDTATQTYHEFEGSGTLNITANESNIFSIYRLSGTFSFTGVNPDHPSETIQVTNGNFDQTFTY